MFIEKCRKDFEKVATELVEGILEAISSVALSDINVSLDQELAVPGQREKYSAAITFNVIDFEPTDAGGIKVNSKRSVDLLSVLTGNIDEIVNNKGIPRKYVAEAVVEYLDNTIQLICQEYGAINQNEEFRRLEEKPSKK